MKIYADNKYYKRALKRESQFREGTDSMYDADPIESVKYEQKNRFGDENKTDLEFFGELGHFKRGLSIGSGLGSFEISLLKQGIIDQIDFVDISEKAIEALKAKAIENGVKNKIGTYSKNLNFIELEENKYDFIACLGVLHHVINLEECLFQLNKSLSDDGILLIDDCISERKMYRTETHMKTISLFRSYLKENFGIETNEFVRTNTKILTNNCPFECIRSHELENIIEYYFGEKKIIENKYRHIFHARKMLMKEYSQIFFSELVLFDKMVRDSNIIKANKIFGIYRKSSKSLLESKPRTFEEIKENIKVNLINEKFLMKFGNNISKKMPGIATILKRIYFMLRK